LQALEARAEAAQTQVDLFAPPPISETTGPSLVESRLSEIDPDALSPREALDILYSLKKIQASQ
jgi:DNA mismatch repair protein MutS